MKARILNLSSSFDWVSDAQKILKPVDEDVIVKNLALESHLAEKIRQRLSELKYVFLINEIAFLAQIDKNPYGEGDDDNIGIRKRNYSFIPRRGGNQESTLYRQPRSIEEGGIVEPLGFYTKKAKTFAQQAGLELERSPRGGKVKKGCLASILPNEVGDEPAIWLCPERLFKLPYELEGFINDDEPRPKAHLNLTELFFRMTIFHELGHHLLQCPEKMPNENMISEGLANHFCHQMLKSGERIWLFVKAWLLQPVAYLAYFVPRFLDIGERTCFEKAWLQIVYMVAQDEEYEKISGAVLGSCLKEEALMAKSTSFICSPQLADASWKMLRALPFSKGKLFAHAIDSIEPCNIGPFDEYELPSKNTSAAIKLLRHKESTVQVAACRSLSKKYVGVPEIDSALCQWVDQSYLSSDDQICRQAWKCGQIDREKGREARYHNSLDSKNPFVQVQMICRLMQYFQLKEAFTLLVKINGTNDNTIREACSRVFELSKNMISRLAEDEILDLLKIPLENEWRMFILDKFLDKELSSSTIEWLSENLSREEDTNCLLFERLNEHYGKDNRGSLLLSCIKKKKHEYIKEIFSKGCDPNRWYAGETRLYALHIACGYIDPPDIELIRLLLFNGADLAMRDSNGNTALMLAATIDHNEDVIQLLIDTWKEQNSDDKEKTRFLKWINHTNKNGESALSLSKKGNRGAKDKMADILINEGGQLSSL